ncbi:MAG: hypothetical protein K0R84_1450 [Clostridia bacterium]|nr:hypothetical protein [Clostridia bacterium]
MPEYIPKYTKIEYSYDFGDGWEHYITVERIIEEYNRNHPVCIEGEGTTPPEDVGGESGYDDFLDILSNPKHPEYADTLSWSIMQMYQAFDIESVNRRLKSALRRW